MYFCYPTPLIWIINYWCTTNKLHPETEVNKDSVKDILRKKFFLNMNINYRIVDLLSVTTKQLRQHLWFSDLKGIKIAIKTLINVNKTFGEKKNSIKTKVTVFAKKKTCFKFIHFTIIANAGNSYVCLAISNLLKRQLI